MPMPSIRWMWTTYKREGFGLTPNGRVRILAQDAFYMGAHSVLLGLATLIERGDVEEAHQFIARERRRIQAMRGMKPG